MTPGQRTRILHAIQHNQKNVIRRPRATPKLQPQMLFSNMDCGSTTSSVPVLLRSHFISLKIRTIRYIKLSKTKAGPSGTVRPSQVGVDQESCSLTGAQGRRSAALWQCFSSSQSAGLAASLSQELMAGANSPPLPPATSPRTLIQKLWRGASDVELTKLSR